MHRLTLRCLLTLSLIAAMPAGAQAQGRGHGAGGVGVGAGGVGAGGGGVGVGLGGGWPGQRPALPSLPPTSRGDEPRGRVIDESTRTPPGLLQKAEHAADPTVAALTGVRGPGHGLSDAARSRRTLIDELAITHPERIALDPRGEPALRGEVVLTGPSEALLRSARAAGFGLLREERLPDLDLQVVVLTAPPGWTLEQAQQRLREIDPAAVPAYNHVYLPGGTVGGGGDAPAGSRAPSVAVADRLGLIDGGVDARHPALRGTDVVRQGCTEPVPSAHGTAVASLLAGEDGAFHGAARTRRLYAADIYCGSPGGGALDAVLRALDWMARERVPVVNLSLVGPPNPVLERAVARMVERGHLLVAAVGNDGPAAAPLYPAAYPGVVAVSAVDRRRRVLPEAGRGAHVALVAPGADLAAAMPGEGYGPARGTSFAAPLVAGLLAARLPAPDPGLARAVRDALGREAIDLGAPGRDPVYGLGLVAESTAPSAPPLRQASR